MRLTKDIMIHIGPMLLSLLFCSDATSAQNVAESPCKSSPNGCGSMLTHEQVKLQHGVDNAEDWSFDQKVKNFFDNEREREMDYSRNRQGTRNLQEIKSCLDSSGSRAMDIPVDSRSLQDGARNPTPYYRLWNCYSPDTGKIVIFYTIDEFFDPRYRALIEQVLDEIEEKVKVIVFVEKFTASIASLRFWSGNACGSYIGSSSPFQLQSIMLMDFFKYKGIGCPKSRILKEIIRSLGFQNEENRIDRDDYVNILYENVMDGFNQTLMIPSHPSVDSLEVEYDYDSIMHSSAWIHTKNGEKTIDAGDRIIGQATELSEKDILQVQLMYQCITGPRSYGEFKAEPCTANCTCVLNQAGCMGDNDLCKGTNVCVNNMCVPQPSMSPSAVPGSCADDSLFLKGGKKNRSCSWVKNQVVKKINNCKNDKCKLKAKEKWCGKKADYPAGDKKSKIKDFCKLYCENCDDGGGE